MGRGNTSSYDDILLQKTKAIFCQVIENLNKNKEIDNVHALSSRETIDRWNDGSSSSSTTLTSKTKWSITFEQFVEHLDGHDEFVQHMAELLVSETIRTAIDKSIDIMASNVHGRESGPPLLQTDVGCLRDEHHSRRIRQGIERLTRSNRRSALLEVDAISSSNSSERSDSLDAEDFPHIGIVPRAPPSVLQADSASHISRSEIERNLARDREEDRQEREFMIQAMSEQLSARERSSNQNLRRRESGIFHRPAPLENDTSRSARIAATNIAALGSYSSNRAIVPLPSEGGTQSAQRDETSPSAGDLSTIYGIPRESESGEDETNTGLRREEFEAFATSRRYHDRSQSAIRRQAEESTTASTPFQIEDQAMDENETFHRALGTLFRADETIRQVSQEAAEIDSAAASTTTTRLPSARRYALPPPLIQRPVRRMPPALRMPSRLPPPLLRREGSSL